jgi:hypothetical protein
MKKIFILLNIVLMGALISQAQVQNIYIAPSANMVTHPGATMTIYGNLINDARGTAATASTSNAGVNHNGGGTVYLYRHVDTGNSRIYDGTDNSLYGTGTDAYNAGGKAVRFYNLVTDNNVGVATPSGTLVNATSGSGHIQFEQEVAVSNQLDFVNGIVWTPRGLWRHAYLHFDANNARYVGAGSSNTAFSSPATNMQVDGYVAKTGASDFVFPIGDGIYTRFAALSSPNNGQFKAAYFKKDAHTLTSSSGLSGSSTQGSVASMHGGITNVSTAEFWDIDGTAASQYSLYAFNSAAYSNWNSDFATVPTAMPSNIVIAALDDWENLGASSAPSTYSVDGIVTTHAIPTIPDAGSMASPATGNTFVAYTWALAPTSVPLPLQLLSFGAVATACKAKISWASAAEQDVQSYTLQYSNDARVYQEIAVLLAQGNNSHYQYSYEQTKGKGFYRLQMKQHDGAITYSNVISVQTDCAMQYEIVAYPNPVVNQLLLKGLSAGQTLALYGINGQRLRVEMATGSTAQIDMSTYADGTYTLLVGSADRNIATIKILVQH